MGTFKLQTTKASGLISPDDYETFTRVLNAMGMDTAHPDIQPKYDALIDMLATFGSCPIATALFIADRNQKGENWHPVLVRDEEFSEDHPLATHWVASNGEINIDLTVADQEKDVEALGSEAEMDIVRSYETDGHTLKRLEAGVSRFRDEKGNALGMTAQDLYEMIYMPLLSQPVRPSSKIHVVPVAHLTRS